MRQAGLRCFGPDREAARLEGSKAFTKDFLARHRIPTAAYASFTELEAASAYIEKVGAPVVVKADGLAAGKGVVVTDSREEALQHGERCLAKGGGRVVVEEYLDGIIKVRINPEKGREEAMLSRHYGVRGYPAIFMHSGASKTLSTVDRLAIENGQPRLLEAEEFVDVLREAAER